MKLDERFKITPFCCFDVDSEKCSEYINQKGYFANDIDFFKCIDFCEYGTLEKIYCDEAKSFQMREKTTSFRFFIPECFVKPKEKKYRPYTLNEFLDKYRVCANIKIRQKDKRCQYFGKIIGYSFPTDPSTGEQRRDNDAIVCIGGYNFKLIELFNDYEQYDDMKEDKWVPCGVEVKE